MKSVLISAQQEYQKKQLHRQRIVLLWRFLLLLLFFSLWEISADTGLIDAFIFSSPSGIGKTFWHMARDGSIFYHTGITLIETVLSFGCVTLFSLLCALALWRSRLLFDILEPYLVILNSLPKSALAPLLLVWLGSNPRTIVVVAISIAVFGSILTLHTGFQETDADKIRLIYSLGGGKREVLWKILLPSSIPLLISNMKVNVGLCLVGVIIGEFLAAKAGLGYLIIYSTQVFKLDIVMMSIVILCLVSALLYQMVSLLEEHMQKKP
ncbi:MAG: ABC transporter permease [bacterium]|nr:ABC transporter permease [bacterium]